MTDLPERLTAAIDNKALSIGEVWNLLQEARDELNAQMHVDIVEGGWRNVADKFKALYETQKEQIERLTKERDHAVADLCRWRSAFAECTPGGSEFMDPESVRDYMQRNKREMVQAKMDRAKAEKETRNSDRRGFERALGLAEQKVQDARFGEADQDFRSIAHNIRMIPYTTGDDK